MRDTSLSSQQPGTTDRSTEFPECLRLLRRLRVWNTRGSLVANDGRHFRYLLPRRRPAGPKEATLLAASSPHSGGRDDRGSATRRWRAVVTCSSLDNDEIMALCDTITNRLVQPEDHKVRVDPPNPQRVAISPQASLGPQLAGACSEGRGRNLLSRSGYRIVDSIAAVLPRSHPADPCLAKHWGNGGPKIVLLSRF